MARDFWQQAVTPQYVKAARPFTDVRAILLHSPPVLEAFWTRLARKRCVFGLTSGAGEWRVEALDLGARRICSHSSRRGVIARPGSGDQARTVNANGNLAKLAVSARIVRFVGQRILTRELRFDLCVHAGQVLGL